MRRCVLLLRGRNIGIVLLLARYLLCIGSRGSSESVVVGEERCTMLGWLLANGGIIHGSSKLLRVSVGTLGSMTSLRYWCGELIQRRRRTCLKRWRHVAGRYAGRRISVGVLMWPRGNLGLVVGLWNVIRRYAGGRISLGILVLSRV